MKRFLLVGIFFAMAVGMVCAQEVGGPDPFQMGIASAQQELKEVSVDKFENEGFWFSSMSSDQGYTSSRLFASSGPAAKEPIRDEENIATPERHVFGTRVDFLRRGHNSFTIRPVRPIPIEGITKTVSIWVAGRNFDHDLVLLIQDFFGRNYEIYMGKLNFQGWKRMTVAIPPQSINGVNGVVQRSYHYNNQVGIKIMGFRIECNPAESYGTYYIYFDDLRAVTDLFAENNRDEDDMVDGW